MDLPIGPDEIREGESIRVEGVVYVVKRVHNRGDGSFALDLDSPHLDDSPSIRDVPRS